MNVVFLGATRGMGRALARAMAERGDSLFVLGRNPADLERTASDLTARSGRTTAGFAECDLMRPESFAPALDAAERAFGGRFDCVVVTAGLFATQDELEGDADLARRVLTTDFTNTVLFCEHARKRLLGSGGGKLCVFSSVAGERGRKPVILYGASKAGLSRYLEGIDHKFRAEGLEVITVKPGFVRTSMTQNLKAPPFAGEPESVARRVLRPLDSGRAGGDAPLAWAPLNGRLPPRPRVGLRLLPRSLHRPLNAPVQLCAGCLG
ncbi:MAG: SDR family NAD(P)-dependent oxidoreductase [Phycisphaerales bacterium JB054]